MDPAKVETNFDYRKPIKGKVLKALVRLFVPEGAVFPTEMAPQANQT